MASRFILWNMENVVKTLSCRQIKKPNKKVAPNKTLFYTVTITGKRFSHFNYLVLQRKKIVGMGIFCCNM